VILLSVGENIEALSSYYYSHAFTTKIYRLYKLALLPYLRTGFLIRGYIRQVKCQFSLVFPICGKGILPATSLNDSLRLPLLGLVISNGFPSVGLSVTGSACSRVALEVILHKVDLVLVTRMWLRSEYGIAEGFK
jgi:hypothetical protein